MKYNIEVLFEGIVITVFAEGKTISCNDIIAMVMTLKRAIFGNYKIQILR